jgi:dTDP-4-amino-4,6-dideoxygalactose transaminase
MKKLEKPIYITRPILPKQTEVNCLFDEIWKSQWLTNQGQKHIQLEERLKVVLGVPYLSLFNNGTIALLVAIRALNLTGEVITTPFTFPATTHSLEWNKIEPVFCDIDEETLTIDPQKLEQLITPKTTGILGVHVYGMPCHVDIIQEIADSNNLKVIYDGAHAFNSEINGVAIGMYGHVTMYSFHATKLFHTIEGGALATKEEYIKTRIDLMKNFGIKNEEEVVISGINGKMNEFQAAIGIKNLDLLKSEREKRKIILQRYLDNLKDIPGIEPFIIPENVQHSYQYFMIRIREDYGMSRDDLYTILKQLNVYSRKYFFPLCSNLPTYQHLQSAKPSNLPVANKIVKEVLCLPFYGGLEQIDIDNICSMIKEIGKS